MTTETFENLTMEERERVGPRTDLGIALGAVFSFMAWVTTRGDIQVGENHEPGVLIDRFKEWSAHHGVDPGSEQHSLVLTWNEGHTDGIDTAWGVIANVDGGGWDTQSEEWREAARRWHGQNMVRRQGSDGVERPS